MGKMAGRTVSKFVSKKMSKVRWKPSAKSHIIPRSTVFATGSWDDDVGIFRLSNVVNCLKT